MVALPKDITIQQVIDLRKEYWTLWDENLKKTPVYSNDIDNFNKKIQLVGISKESTPKEIGITLEQWYEILEKGQTTTTNEPKYEQVDSTVPDLIKLEQLEKERVLREEQIAKTRENAQKHTADILKQQKIIQDQIKLTQNLQQKYNGKKVYATIEQQILVASLEAQKSFETLTQYATYNEHDLTDQFTAEIQRKAGLAESDELVARTLAVQLVADIANSDETKKALDEIAIEEAIKKDEEKVLEQVLQKEEIVIENAKKGAALEAEKLKGSVYLTKEVAENILPPDVFRQIYGLEQINVTLSSEKGDNTKYEVDLGNSNKAFAENLKEQNKFLDSVREGGVDGAKSVFRNQLYSNVNTYLAKAPKGSALEKIYSSDAVKAILTKGSANAIELRGYTTAGKFIVNNFPEYAPYFKLFSEVTGVSVGIGTTTKIIPLTFGGGIRIGKIAAIQQISIAKAPFTYAVATGNKIAIGAGANTALKTGVIAGFGSLLAKGAAAIGVSLGVFTAGVSTAVTLAIVAVGKMINWPKIKQWFMDNKEVFVGLGAGAGLLIGGPVAGGLALGLGLLATGTLGAFAFGAFNLFGFIGRSIGVAIATPVIVTLLVLPPLVAFIMLVINNSAYVVPYSNRDRSNPPLIGVPPPGGGQVSSCKESNETGKEITEEMASRIKNGIVNLLPQTVWGRSDGICIKPTMIIMHWSGGTNDNPDGNQRTYETLVARNLSCQLATDINDTWLMEKFFEKQVEFPACAGEWNTYSINNEMAGVYFTASPPPPNLEELDLAYDATCKIMEQYEISWSQIYGHYQVPIDENDPSKGTVPKDDPGRDFLEKVFIPEIKRRCPNE